MSKDSHKELIEIAISVFCSMFLIVVFMKVFKIDIFVFYTIVLCLLILIFGIIIDQYEILKDFEFRNIEFPADFSLSWLGIFLSILTLSAIKINPISTLITCTLISYVFLGKKLGWISLLRPVKSIIRCYNICRAIIILRNHSNAGKIESKSFFGNSFYNKIKMEIKIARIDAHLIAQGCYISIYTSIVIGFLKSIIFNEFFSNFFYSLFLIIFDSLAEIFINMFVINLEYTACVKILEISIKYFEKTSESDLFEAEQIVIEYLETNKVPFFFDSLKIIIALSIGAAIGVCGKAFLHLNLYEKIAK